MEVRNLLDDWYKKLLWESSKLNPNPRLERSSVKYVYGVFKEYFGIEYFKIKGPKIVSAENENWLFYILSRSDKSAFLALEEICSLLVYSTSLEEGIQNKLFTVSHLPRQFREALFEIYIYAFLDRNKISNKKKIWKKGQELEGTLFLSEREFIFECKKSLVSGVGDIADLKNLSIVFYKFFQTLDYGSEVKGYYLYKNKNKLNNASNSLELLLKKYKQQLITSKGANNRFFYEDINEELNISTFSQREMIILKEEKKGNVVFFEIIAPPVIIPNKINNYRVHLSYGFSITDSDMSGKLISDIKKKRKQLKKFKEFPRIIFIDNETQKDFLFPVSPANIKPDFSKIKAFLESKETDDIVCIVSRNYTTYPPQKKLDVICKDSLSMYKRQLERMSLN